MLHTVRYATNLALTFPLDIDFVVHHQNNASWPFVLGVDIENAFLSTKLFLKILSNSNNYLQCYTILTYNAQPKSFRDLIDMTSTKPVMELYILLNSTCVRYDTYARCLYLTLILIYLTLI